MRHNFAPQKGLSLVELMVGLTVGLVISLGLFMLVANTSRAFKVQDDFARLQDNGSSALRYIVDDLRMAGFYGLGMNTQSILLDAATLTAAGISSISPDCGAPSGTIPWALLLTQPIVVVTTDSGGAALNSGNVNATFPCIQGNDYATANSAVMVMRGALGFQVPDTNNDGDLGPELTVQPNYATTLYVQSSPNQDPNTFLFAGANFAALKGAGTTRSLSSGADAPIFEYQTHVYYIRPCSRPTAPAIVCSTALNDDGGTSIPTLVRHELVGNAMQLVPLVEGIERINLMFGIDADNDGTAEQFIANPTAAQWSQVISARVSVLARTPSTSPGYSDATKTYDLGGGVTFTCTAGVDCNFKRHVFSQIASVRNCAQRRGGGRSC